MPPPTALSSQLNRPQLQIRTCCLIRPRSVQPFPISSLTGEEFNPQHRTAGNSKPHPDTQDHFTSAKSALQTASVRASLIAPGCTAALSATHAVPVSEERVMSVVDQQSIITQVTREDDQLNTYRQASGKSRPPTLQMLLSGTFVRHQCLGLQRLTFYCFSYSSSVEKP